MACPEGYNVAKLNVVKGLTRHNDVEMQNLAGCYMEYEDFMENLRQGRIALFNGLTQISSDVCDTCIHNPLGPLRQGRLF